MGPDQPSIMLALPAWAPREDPQSHEQAKFKEGPAGTGVRVERAGVW